MVPGVFFPAIKVYQKHNEPKKHLPQSNPSFSFCHTTTSLFSSHGKRIAEGVNYSSKPLRALLVVHDGGSPLPGHGITPLVRQGRAISPLGWVVWPMWAETRCRAAEDLGSGSPRQRKHDRRGSPSCFSPVKLAPSSLLPLGSERGGMAVLALGHGWVFHSTKFVWLGRLIWFSDINPSLGLQTLGTIYHALCHY